MSAFFKPTKHSKTLNLNVKFSKNRSSNRYAFLDKRQSLDQQYCLSKHHHKQYELKQDGNIFASDL